MAAVSGGSHVYETFCAACHSGGDETAPELKTLHTFNRERVATALSDKGLMALQSTLINAAQREQVIAFLTAPPAALAQLEAANRSADPAGLKRDAYGVPYIFSDTDAGATFASGYVAAADRGLLISQARTAGVAALADMSTFAEAGVSTADTPPKPDLRK